MTMIIEPGDIVIDKEDALGPCGVATSGIYNASAGLGLAVDVRWLFADYDGKAWRMTFRSIRLHCPADKL